MKILIADDDFDLRLALQGLLPRWGFDVVHANDGIEAWQVLQAADPPRLAILDWMMPGMDGLEVCQQVRDHPDTAATYLILLTARLDKEDMMMGLVNGADDYLTKPVDFEVLRGRLLAARRLVDLQEQLARRLDELQGALAQVAQLQCLLPVCPLCKEFRADPSYRKQVQDYWTAHPEIPLRPSLCAECRVEQLQAARETSSPGTQVSGFGPRV